MDIGKVDVPIGKIVKEAVTLNVELRASGVRWFEVRVWLGSRILNLGAFVIGCGIEIDSIPGPDIHTLDDGRGPRDVYLNGEKIEGVIYADTERGIVKQMDKPIRLDSKKRLVSHVLRGEVKVVPSDQH